MSKVLLTSIELNNMTLYEGDRIRPKLKLHKAILDVYINDAEVVDSYYRDNDISIYLHDTFDGLMVNRIYLDRDTFGLEYVSDNYLESLKNINVILFNINMKSEIYLPKRKPNEMSMLDLIYILEDYKDKIEHEGTLVDLRSTLVNKDFKLLNAKYNSNNTTVYSYKHSFEYLLMTPDRREIYRY